MDDGSAWAETIAADIDPTRPVLIAGPTASGKSALALAVARRTGGPVVNADALQVFADWRVLTARPSVEEEALLPHLLYGHVPGTAPYSVGHWLRDVMPFLDGSPPVIVGGTGLNFTALTEGLADIPDVPDEVRDDGSRRLADGGLDALLGDLDAQTRARIDPANPRRVARAWEVLQATGRGLAAWQDETAPPRLPVDRCTALVLHAPPDWLGPRIDARLDAMLAGGALEEAAANAPTWRPDLPSAKAIGAADLVAVVRGDVRLEVARTRMATLTRQYAKRQRTWFRRRMAHWRWLTPR